MTPERDVGYDEFALLAGNAEEYDLPFDTDDPPVVRRTWVADTPSGHDLSAIVWGEGEPELVLLHGGAQNAHTWDTVALALGRPLVAVDLPGHGHSAWRPDRDYRPEAMADDVAHVIATLAPGATTLAGMSLGGLTALAAISGHGGAADRLVLVDITPGVTRDKASVVTSFVAGPPTFASFDEILARTIEFNPTRSRASLERGVRHNAHQREDGTWSWRYDRFDAERFAELDTRFADLWDAIGALPHPLTLLRGGDSPVVDDEDVAELRRRRPDADVVVVAGAGHSIQGDRPLELAELLLARHA